MAVVVYKFSRSGGARVKSERMEEERIVGGQVEKTNQAVQMIGDLIHGCIRRPSD